MGLAGGAYRGGHACCARLAVDQAIAHRGLADNAGGRPENSLAAFAAAVAAGCPAELDVQLTADGELVVMHDFELSRLTGHPQRTEQLSPGVRKRLRLLDTEQTIPTLGEVLELVNGQVPLLIELKRPRPTRHDALVPAAIRALSRYHGEYALCSFDPLLVRHLRSTVPGTGRGQISGLLRTADPVTRLLGRSLLTNFLTRPDFISQEFDAFPSPIVSWWRRRGVAVLAWGVTSREEERAAGEYADNVVFTGYLPAVYRRESGD